MIAVKTHKPVIGGGVGDDLPLFVEWVYQATENMVNSSPPPQYLSVKRASLPSKFTTPNPLCWAQAGSLRFRAYHNHYQIYHSMCLLHYQHCNYCQ